MARGALVLATLALAPRCLAALAWDRVSVDTTALAGDREVIAVFPFHNAGPGAVTLSSIHTSCSCTIASASAATFRPGEQGEVHAVFTLGDRIGRQEKLVTVTTADASPPVTLALRVDIREVIAASPQILRWRLGEPPVERPIELEAVSPHRLALIEPPHLADVACRLEVVTPGRHYRLWLKPLSTALPQREALHGLAHVVNRAAVPVFVYAVVE